jgi:hypothetical protein
MKPDVIAQTIQLEKERSQMAEQAAAAGSGGGGGGQIILQQPGQPPIALNNEQVVQVIQQLQGEVEKLKEENRILQAKNAFLLQNQAPLPLPLPQPPRDTAENP